MLGDKLLQLARASPGEKVSLAEGLRQHLSAADLSYLVATLQDLDDARLDAALRLLIAGPLPLDRESQLALNRVVPELVRRQYPSPLGTVALMMWRMLDQSAAQLFLTRELDVASATLTCADAVVADLAATPGDEALSLLERLAKLPGSAGAEARRWVELREPSEDRLLEVRRKWEFERSASALSDLYGVFGRRLRFGVTTSDEVLDVFGKPDRSDRTIMQYSPSSSTSASFELDGKGHVIGSHLT